MLMGARAMIGSVVGSGMMLLLGGMGKDRLLR